MEGIGEAEVQVELEGSEDDETGGYPGGIGRERSDLGVEREGSETEVGEQDSDAEEEGWESEVEVGGTEAESGGSGG